MKEQQRTRVIGFESVNLSDNVDGKKKKIVVYLSSPIIIIIIMVLSQ